MSGARVLARSMVTLTSTALYASCCAREQRSPTLARPLRCCSSKAALWAVQCRWAATVWLRDIRTSCVRLEYGILLHSGCVVACYCYSFLAQPHTRSKTLPAWYSKYAFWSFSIGSHIVLMGTSGCGCCVRRVWASAASGTMDARETAASREPRWRQLPRCPMPRCQRRSAAARAGAGHGSCPVYV